MREGQGSQGCGSLGEKRKDLFRVLGVRKVVSAMEINKELPPVWGWSCKVHGRMSQFHGSHRETDWKEHGFLMGLRFLKFNLN